VGLERAVLLVATITTGLTAGLFYAFSCSVMPGLRRVDDRSFVATMRAINVAILNGWFLIVFLGAPLVAVGAAVLQIDGEFGPSLLWSAAGAAACLVTLVVTGAVNVPLNDRLADERGEPGQLRVAFERRWNRANVVRTVSSVTAFGCFALALARG
jgi:uncharacterized membrane protein